MTYTEADLDRLSWHDNHIYGFQILVGDVEANDWMSDLLLDLDYIVEWVPDRESASGMSFRVAPATLAFHGVTDLSIKVDWEYSGFQVALHEMSIDRIFRDAIRDQKVYLDRPYYAWHIRLNWPAAGEIRFGAVGFTQTLRSEPILTPHQKLTPSQRSGK